MAGRDVEWLGSTNDELRSLPKVVRNTFGFALYLAQCGGKHAKAKPLVGFGGAGVLEVVEDHVGDTYRAVYTVRYPEAVYVLHVFQKRSKSGIGTPQPDIDTIRRRLREAERVHQERTRR